MGRQEYLAGQSKQPLADLERKLEVIECIELVYEDKGGIPHFVHPEI